MGLSKKLAGYMTSLAYDELPDEVVQFAKLCILDYFGSAIAGRDKAPIQMIAAFSEEMGGNEQATAVTGGKTSVMNAALVNGAASHMVELDDIHKGSIIHAATVVIPAAMAIAEWKRRSGKDVIAAVVAGYEVCYRIGEAVSPSHYYYWHNTATCGTFGAAAAAAKLLNATEEQTVHALGHAGTQAAGLWEFIVDGAMTKQLHPGKAAMNGVISALLAVKNFTGAKKILEGNRGFFRAMSEQFDASKVTEQLGKEHKIVENSFKIYASCRHTHPVMDEMIELAKTRYFRQSDIDHIVVQTYQAALDITDNDEPKTVYEAKFSLQFCTALALLRGKGGLDDFNEETLWDHDIRALMKRVKLMVDRSMDAAYPNKWGASIAVHLINGETLAGKTDFPKGDPEKPVAPDELIDKFHRLAKHMPDAAREQLANGILALEQLPNVQGLLNALHQ